MTFALDPRLAQICDAGPLEFGELLQRLALGFEHGVDEMGPALWICEEMRDKQPLVDLEAFLGALLLEGAFARNALTCRHQTGKPGGDPVKQIADPQRLAAIVGDRVVDLADVPAQKPFLGRAGARLDVVGVLSGVRASRRRWT